MSEANGTKRFVVLAPREYPDKNDPTKILTRWVKVGKAWPAKNGKEGCFNVVLDAFPVGTGNLIIREDDYVPLAPGTRRPQFETIEVRP
jgi:hypothetical protein